VLLSDPTGAGNGPRAATVENWGGAIREGEEGGKKRRRGKGNVVRERPTDLSVIRRVYQRPRTDGDDRGRLLSGQRRPR